MLNYLNNNDIAHRINEIRQSTDPDNWQYIKSEQNPAGHITCYQDFLSLSKITLGYLDSHFLRKNHALK